MLHLTLFAVGMTPLPWIIAGIVAVLLFGNRLPSVMRSVGRSVTEFKKGVAGIEEDMDEAVRSSGNKSKPKLDDDSEA